MSLAMITGWKYQDFTYEIQQIVPDGIDPTKDWHTARHKFLIQCLDAESWTKARRSWGPLLELPIHIQAEILAAAIQSEFGNLPTLVRVIKATGVSAASTFLHSELTEGALVVRSPETDLTGVDPIRGDEAHRWSALMKGQNPNQH